MPNKYILEKEKLLTRRNLLRAGFAGVGAFTTAGLWHLLYSRNYSKVRIPSLNTDSLDVSNSNQNSNQSFNPMKVLRDFDYGTLKRENGRNIREFRIVAENITIELNSAVTFNAWTFNNRLPGPTLRANVGDRVRVIFQNHGGHSHSMHFHGTHPSSSDGVRPVTNGKETVYEFNAEPYGCHLYHCHIEPVTRHISKGLYGMFIIDPPRPRPPADEMVLVMAGYDINNQERNQLYAFNGIPEYYMDHPIRIYQNQLIRLYVLNMIEFDEAATFHIHANFFKVYPTGMTTKPVYETDVITMGTAERHILEFSYKYEGIYMFHPHQDIFAQKGCMGNFEVIPG